MENFCTVNILLSTYNGDRYLSNFLESLECQQHSNWVLIVRDDNSSDNSKKIIKSFYEKHNKKVIITKDNTGNCGSKISFSHLMANAEHDYIMFADQDDYWLPNKIQQMLAKIRILEESFDKSQPILIHSDLAVVDEKLNEISPSFWKHENISPYNKNKMSDYLIQNYVAGCTVIINRALLNLASPIPSGAIMHDWWCALVAASFGKIDCINESTILYRQHNNNVVGAQEYTYYNLLSNFLRNNKKYSNSVLQYNQQAKALYELYFDKLSQHDKNCIEAFLKLSNINIIHKIYLITRYRIYKSDFFRTLGFLFLA
jgi:glycosyltransferase involved in cell wall biosynthesis